MRKSSLFGSASMSSATSSGEMYLTRSSPECVRGMLECELVE